MKVDAKGNPEVGGSPQGNDQGRRAQYSKTSDGGYTVGGYTDNFPNFMMEYYSKLIAMEISHKFPRKSSTYVPNATTTAGVITSKLLFFFLIF